jgi:hypothetical protein
MGGLGLRLDLRLVFEGKKLNFGHRSRRREEMDDSELFDVFNIDNNPEPEQKTIEGQKKRKTKKSKKSREEKRAGKEKSANGVNGKRSHEELSTKSDDEEEEAEPKTVSKKLRKLEENPIIVDSFETESDQVVRATQGLQGIAPTDENIIIKKKVSPRIWSIFVDC